MSMLFKHEIYNKDIPLAHGFVNCKHLLTKALSPQMYLVRFLVSYKNLLLYFYIFRRLFPHNTYLDFQLLQPKI